MSVAERKMDERNRQSHRSTGIRTAANSRHAGNQKSTGQRHRVNYGTQTRPVQRRPSGSGSHSAGRPLSGEQHIARRKRQKRKRIKAIAVLIIAILIIIGIIIGIVAIVNGAKDDNGTKTTTGEMTSNDETKPENETAEAETTEPETTATALAPNDGSSVVKPENWNGKTVYITFDDGPSAVTKANLEVLDQYGVKATFFCLGFAPAESYQELVNRGHALAAHSYSHDYDTIYASLDNFAADVQAIKKVLEDATGTEVFLYRFPGGSNNQVHDCPSMTELANYIESIGMKYVDWNADSTDAEYTTAEPDVLIAHSLADIEYWGDETDQDTIVLLMHDSEYKTSGTECLASIIPYLLEKGYAFDRITRDTPDVHFVLPD